MVCLVAQRFAVRRMLGRPHLRLRSLCFLYAFLTVTIQKARKLRYVIMDSLCLGGKTKGGA